MPVTDPACKARRTGGRSARVRASVLSSTLEILLEDKSDDLSIRDVARRAGVHETSIYRRWGTRANLILDAVLCEVQAAVPTPDTGSLRGDLIALHHSVATFITTPVGELLLRLALRSGLPDEHEVRERFWAERFTAGQAVLDRAQARGEVRADLDCRLVLEILIGVLYVRMLLTREPIDSALTERTVDLVLIGIRSSR